MSRRKVSPHVVFIEDILDLLLENSAIPASLIEALRIAVYDLDTHDAHYGLDEVLNILKSGQDMPDLRRSQE